MFWRKHGGCSDPNYGTLTNLFTLIVSLTWTRVLQIDIINELVLIHPLVFTFTDRMETLKHFSKLSHIQESTFRIL